MNKLIASIKSHKPLALFFVYLMSAWAVLIVCFITLTSPIKWGADSYSNMFILTIVLLVIPSLYWHFTLKYKSYKYLGIWLITKFPKILHRIKNYYVKVTKVDVKDGHDE